ncbi:hypothetical protein AKO1_008135 [Acrasis kona]|uniref:Uncharacterized protein n=1 Tax=Acrasis kona TaxID=1008807 RepID=A0AAW2YMD2_9EUKA
MLRNRTQCLKLGYKLVNVPIARFSNNFKYLNKTSDEQNSLQTDASELTTIQQSVDKLSKKQEEISKSIGALTDMIELMSASVQITAEQQMNFRTLNILKANKLLPFDTTLKSFLKINTITKAEEYLKTFTKDVNILDADRIISSTIEAQAMVGHQGSVITYKDAAVTSSPWITPLLNVPRGGKKRMIVSGEISVLGTLDNIVKCLHRALRYPVLVRRYTNRLYQSLYNSKENLGLEHVVIFVNVAALQTQVPSRFFNRILTKADLGKLEEAVLDLFEGEVYIPNDDEISSYLNTDPNIDILGVWKALLVAEIDGRLAVKTARDSSLLEDCVRDYVMLLVLLRICSAHNFEVYLGSIINPLA